MVITVSCPSCSSSFPVDPAKVPEGGVNARCSMCSSVFRVEKPAAEPTFGSPAGSQRADAGTEFVVPDLPPPAPVEDADVSLEGPAEDWTIEAEDADDATLPELPTFAVDEGLPPLPELPEDPAGRVASEPAPGPAIPEPAAPEPTIVPPEPEAPATEGFRFGKRDPKDKARRLARVLVSDMIMYNAERHQNALTGGTLAQDFEEEIDKSWKEYVEQVGDELAQGEGRQYWTEALNDILAKGREVF